MSTFGAKAKKAWAGGIAGAVVGATSFSWGHSGSISNDVANFCGAVVVGFVGGFLVVFIAPKNKTS
jgi:uncharacterized membrane protein YjjB (DUF3815 family)